MVINSSDGAGAVGVEGGGDFPVRSSLAAQDFIPIITGTAVYRLKEINNFDFDAADLYEYGGAILAEIAFFREVCVQTSSWFKGA